MFLYLLVLLVGLILKVAGVPTWIDVVLTVQLLIGAILFSLLGQVLLLLNQVLQQSEALGYYTEADLKLLRGNDESA